jgi:uncharacterized protein (DUF4415 family)
MTKNHTLKTPMSGHADWDRINALSDADIERMAELDTENPASSAADWVNATIDLPALKTPVNAKFDIDVVNWFKGQSRGYQTRMNAVLRHDMEAHKRTG